MTSRRRTSTSTLLAGWLFADLLLGVTIIMLGAQSPDPHPRAAAGSRPTTEAVRSTTATEAEAEARTSGTRTPQPTEAPQTGTPQTGASQTGAPKTGTSQTGEPEPAPESQATGKSQGARESQGAGKAGPTATGTARPLRDTVRPLPTPSPTPDRPSPRARPRPSPCVSRLGDVQAKPITISFQLSPGMRDEALAVQVRQELLRHRDQLAGRHAGMVLTFGADGGGGNGVRLATRVNAAIRETYPRIFGAAVTRNFHDLAAPPGSISMEVYLMTYGCSPVSGS
ncbi:hypothetical protein [Streptosporangium saharense]|uniref:hypothetical protein n=1 Tax=Streptosporangium saharense TaxID=1706840 RepID=UPI00332BED63